jgi:signal transduction histidine kinase
MTGGFIGQYGKTRRSQTAATARPREYNTTEFSTLVQFSKLVSDSTTSDSIFAILGRTVVEQCHAAHALVFGTSDNGDFKVLSSYGACDDAQISALDLADVGSVPELSTAVMKACKGKRYGFRTFPFISDAGLLGALLVLYSEDQPLSERQWTLIEGLTELTAISLNKTYQHQKLQKAFDDLRISQEALIRTEKFRALGQMSAGIAHDLKNLLNPLLLYTDHMRDAAGNKDEVIDVLNRVERILQRGLETVERLRDFSRQSPDETEAAPTDLNAMVREAVEISKARLGGIQLVLTLGAPPRAVFRPADCVTAIVNLVLNAADAIQGKGTIIISTGSSDGGGWVEVADNGPGIPPEIKGKILEPFFTTKGDAGTGLGTSIVYAFTQRYGGRLEIESEVGQGAKFRMWFPAAVR